MRFVRVVVKNFQAIESADVSLGPGLNVLFGPNDLGKSTLACAMRAALLVPPSSSEASRYLPWFVDVVPEVTLTFVDDDSRFWRVRKCFGATSAQTSADLHHSKDGATFTHDSGGREVDERLRDLLGWGIPSPGGKGAPKKLPTSFLAQVLLAEQTDVETILGQSTDGDGTTSGYDRLRKALAALAEDPWFKKVLTETQLRVAHFFTPTGQFKRGRGSPFTAASDDLKRRAERVERLRKDVADSQNTEEYAGRLRDEYSAAHERWKDIAAQLVTVRQQHTRAMERSRADEALALAREAVEGIKRQEKDAADFAEGLKIHETELVKAEARMADARAATESADAAVRGAEESLRAVTSVEGAHQREVTRAKLRGELAELGYAVLQNGKRRENAEGAQTAIAGVAIANHALRDLQATTIRVRVAEDQNTLALTNAHAALELARRTLAYGEWYTAEAATREAAEAREAATTAQADATEKEATAQELEVDAATNEAEVVARRSLLPDAALMKRLEELDHQLALAEAALGGGFSLALRGTGKVPVHVTIDEGEVIAGTALEGRLVLDAERKGLVRVGDLLDIEIVAGAAEKRHALEALRERWLNEAEPILQRAAETKLTRIRERMVEVAALEATLAGQRGMAKHLLLEAETARQSATMTRRRAEELTERSREADSMKARLGTGHLEVIAASFLRLGETWRAELEQLIAAKENAVEQARNNAEEGRRLREMTTYQLAEAEGKAAIARAEARRTFAELGLESIEDAEESHAINVVLVGVQAELAAIGSRQSAIDCELGALEHEASDALRAANAFVDETKAAHTRMLENQAQATKSLEESRSAFHAARGQLDAWRKTLESIDRTGAEARARSAQAHVDQFAGEPQVSADQVAAAELLESEAKATLDQVRAELNQADGALTKVGGHGIRDELRREDEAYSLAQDRQRELEIDAEAWKLLGETLEASEKEGSTHLGRVLAAPVSARFAELTKGRYSALHLDQHLKAETVDIPAVTTDGSILEALSVGTRDQIATLLRLTIAEQLKSAIVLDDHLVHTDPERLSWFREMLRRTALNTQVIVLTCRPQDYLALNEVPEGGEFRDLAGGTIRTIDVASVIRRWEPSRHQPIA